MLKAGTPQSWEACPCGVRSRAGPGERGCLRVHREASMAAGLLPWLLWSRHQIPKHRTEPPASSNPGPCGLYGAGSTLRMPGQCLRGLGTRSAGPLHVPAAALPGRWPSPGLAVPGRPPSPGPGPSRGTRGCIYSALLPTQRLRRPPASTPWLCAWRLSHRTLGVDAQRKCLFKRVRKDTHPVCALVHVDTHTSFFASFQKAYFMLEFSPLTAL